MSKISRIIYYFVSLITFIIFNFYITEVFIDSLHNLPENFLFSLTLVNNTGAAFNILEGAKIFLILFSIAAILTVILYTLKYIKKLSMPLIFCSALLNAGIFCNMYERCTLGYVRDFIKVKFIEFPIFNISDIFINISVFVIVFIVVKNTYFNKNENNN